MESSIGNRLQIKFDHSERNKVTALLGRTVGARGAKDMGSSSW